MCGHTVAGISIYCCDIFLPGLTKYLASGQLISIAITDRILLPY